ncbi:hypothetical protein GCM10008090_30090 [Arenicella chitinivorans]|uniref:Ubiquinone biosynthesis accessory factor UbiJ n=1 Tax=Arenicella chitinivorans TaxID=1329800 RepID=A0A918S356_9GAMM|nr:SCP2 sterol-binding domain-containing protein [Arenicella chitinivorans]GHA18479.1 hypothetical protein GCM10008090_30090 [Arenicella chitinivorans]
MLLEILELAGNKTLAYDQAAQARLERLRGKTMALRIKPFDSVIRVTPQASGIEFSHQDDAPVDVSLTATLGAMLKISRVGLENADLAPGELEISGDPIVGQRFAQLIAELDIDWESMLAEQFGETSAKLITHLASEAKAFADESKHRLQQLLNAQLSGQDGLVAPAQAVDQFLDDVDTLRADTDRLSARLSRLLKQAE